MIEPQKIEVLGLYVDDISREALLLRIKELSCADNWAFIVTPNVNHLVRLGEEPKFCETYKEAVLTICDSRILSRIAAHQGKALTVNSGSDLVANILSDNRFETTPITIVGPSRHDFKKLQTLYSQNTFKFVACGKPLQEHSTEWNSLILSLGTDQPGITLICLGSPLQEYLCNAVKQFGNAKGVAIACGASIDFLTGRQRRTPKFIQNYSLEWLFRMLSNPRRLTLRYIKDAIGLAKLIKRGGIHLKANDEQ